MRWRISQAASDQWAEVRDIRLRSLRESPQAYGSAYDLEAPFTEAQWRERMSGAATYLARHSSGELVGTATGLTVSKTDVMLVAMYVSPAARGAGCAQALIDAVVAGGVDRGSLRVVLHVTEGNDIAERCYRRYGFTPTGQTYRRAHPTPLLEHEYALLIGSAVDAALTPVQG